MVSAFRVHVSVRAQSCTAPKALNDVRIDVPFTAMDGKKWEARKLQRQMKAMGVGGKLYDRDSLNDMMDEEGMGDMGDDDSSDSDRPKPTTEVSLLKKTNDELRKLLPGKKGISKLKKEQLVELVIASMSKTPDSD